MKKQLRSGLACMGMATLLGSPLACSFSNSSQSSSDSSNNSSKSSSSSSGKQAAKSFRADVIQYTAAFAKAWAGATGSPDSAAAQGSEEGFLSGLGDLSRRYGISDWEAEPDIWESIGRGLAQAQIGDAERRAYVQAWAAGDSEKQLALERGYEASR